MKTNSGSIALNTNLRPWRVTGFFASVAKSLVVRQLQRLSSGQLIIIDRKDRYQFGQQTEDFSVSATIHVNDESFYSMLAFGGSIGAGESYIMGHWHSDNLTNVVRVMVRNMSLLDGMESGLAGLVAPFRKLLHWFNRNTLTGSRSNIAAHCIPVGYLNPKMQRCSRHRKPN